MDIAATHQLWDRDPAGAAAHFAAESRELLLRESTRGPLRARLWVQPVWQWAPADPVARRRLLIIRREADGTFKYSLSNAVTDTPWERLG